MKKLYKYTSHPAFFLYLSAFLLSFIFVFNKHYIELTGTLETWFPYKGIVLYKEIATFHFPLGRYILMPLHLLSNWNLELDPFLGLAVGIANLVVIYKFGKKWFSKVAVMASLLFFSIFYWYFATGILFFHEQLIGLLLSLALLIFWPITKNKSGQLKKIFWLGVLLSLAEFSGQIATFTVGLLVLLLFKKIWSDKDRANNIRYLLYGLGIPLLFLVIHFAANGALGEFIYWNTIYYVVYSGSASASLIELPWREIIAFFLPLVVIGGYLFKKLYRGKNTASLIFIFVISVSTIPFTIFSIFHLHHFNYALGILAIAAGFAIDCFTRLKHKLFIIFVFLLLCAPVFQWYSERLISPDFQIANDIYPSDPMYSAVGWVKDNTKKDATLMVVGDPLFYMRSDRLPATRASKGIPYSWEPLEQVSQEINNSPQADYWIIDTIAITRLIEVNKKLPMVDFIKTKLVSEYTLTTTFKNWEIWKRK